MALLGSLHHGKIVTLTVDEVSVPFTVSRLPEPPFGVRALYALLTSKKTTPVDPPVIIANANKTLLAMLVFLGGAGRETNMSCSPSDTLSR